MVVTPTNITADEIVHRIVERNNEQHIAPDAIIIRRHVMTTETKIIQTHEPYQVHMDMEELEAISEMDAAKYVHDFYLDVERRPSIVADTRVRLIDQSLGGWMLRVANIITHSFPAHHLVHQDSAKHLCTFIFHKTNHTTPTTKQ